MKNKPPAIVRLSRIPDHSPETQSAIDDLCSDTKAFEEEVEEAKSQRDPVTYLSEYLYNLYRDEHKGTAGINWRAVAREVIDNTGRVTADAPPEGE